MELAIYVAVAAVVMAALFQMLRSGIHLFRSTEGHNESLTAATLVDRLLWEDFTNLHVPGVLRASAEALPELDLGPFLAGKLEGIDGAVPIALPSSRRVALHEGRVLEFHRIRLDPDENRQAVITVRYALSPAQGATEEEKVFVLKRSESDGTERSYPSFRIAELHVDFLILPAPEGSPAGSPPRFFVRWTIVGSSLSRQSTETERGYRNTFMNAVAFRRAGDLLRQGGVALYWNRVDGNHEDMSYVETP